MKNKFLRNFFKYTAIALSAVVILSSCNKDDDDDNGGTTGPVILDGYYIKGSGTALTTLSTVGKMKATKNEVGQADRATLLEYWLPVEAGGEFNIVIVEGGDSTAYGPGDDFAVVDTANNGRIADEPRKPYDFSRGSIKEGTSFTAAKDGLYHVVYDTELEICVVAEAAWGLIGGATPGGWSDNTQLDMTFTKEKVTFALAEVLILDAGDFKYRYSNGWKIVIDGEDVRVNTNLGGSTTALTPGGDNISNDVYGYFAMGLEFELGQAPVATMDFVKDGPPRATYPEELYMIGASIGGWDWAANGIQMIPVHSNAHLFWKVVWIEEGVADAGIKFAPAKEWAGDFGVDAAGGATDGVWGKGSDNLPDDHATGYYLVVVNLSEDGTQTPTVEVIPATVYGIGDAFGTWDAAQASALFTEDNANKLMVSPAFVADAELRIHVASPTMLKEDGSGPVDWWQAEFILTDANVIEYRGTGDDQARTNVTSGQVVKLNFSDETGSIE